jgi:outer membrane protein assembly factor BamB
MFTRSPRGRELFVVDGEVRVFDRLLYSAPNNGPSGYFGGHFLQVGQDGAVIRGTNDRIVRLSQSKTPEGEPVGVWDVQFFRDPHALALCGETVVVAGEIQQEESEMPTFGIAAFDLEHGSKLWSDVLPTAAVSWGLAVNRHGTIVVTSKNGTVTCFGSRNASAGG